MRSACYVYAIVRRDAPMPVAGGVRGAADLAVVPCRELAAITGWMNIDDAPLTLDSIVHHEAIVEAVRERGPALPVRFGTMFRDVTSVESALAERYESLAADLDRLGDKVELSLSAIWGAEDARPSGDRRAPSPPEAGAPTGRSSGANYLHERAAEQRCHDALHLRARVVAQQLEDVLAGRALESRVSLLPTPRMAVRSAYLLDRDGVGAFRGAFDAMRPRPSDVRILLTGPWPPYSFVKRTDTHMENRR